MSTRTQSKAKSTTTKADHMLRINRSMLADALARLTSVIDAKTTIPIVGCVRIHVVKEDVVLTGTDLDNQFRLPVFFREVSHGFDICLHHRSLFNIVKRIKSAEELIIRYTVTAGTGDDGDHDEDDGAENRDHGLVYSDLTISADSTTFALSTYDPEDFPELEVPKTTSPWVKVPALQLKEGLEAVVTSISHEATRQYLGGVYLEACRTTQGEEADGLFLTSTDGHRMAHHHLPDVKVRKEMPSGIVQEYSVKLLLDEIKRQPLMSHISIRVSETKFEAKIGDAVYVGKLIDGTFPDYTRVIPTNGVEFTFDRVRMIEALTAVGIIGASTVKIDVRKNVIELQAQCDGANISTPIAAKNDTEISFGVAREYLHTALVHCAGGHDDVTMSIEDAGSPMKFTCGRTLTVIMPKRV